MTAIIATNQTILVVGGGISGITAALEIAEMGKRVILVEKNPYIGGRVVQLYKYFPKLCHPICGMEINQRRVKANPNLTILTMAEVIHIDGKKGDYSISVKISPRYVNNNCTACGRCAEVVEAEFSSEFNYGMDSHKGAYISYDHAYPQTYVLDSRIIGTDDALKARDVCPVNAIDLDMQEGRINLKAGAVIWATGWRPYDANKIQAYGYDRYQNVITSVEFERLNDLMGPTGGKILRPSDAKEAKKIAFIQCAGSRDANHLDYCSYICCMASLKQSTYVSEKIAEGQSDIYYIDMRAIDRYEDFYKKVQNDKKVNFIRSKVASISLDNETKNPILNGVDTESYQNYSNSYDLVVLAVGMEPNVNADSLSMEVSLNEAGFFEGDEKSDGLFGAGCSTAPLDVNRAVQSATASALRAIQVINQVSGVEYDG